VTQTIAIDHQPGTAEILSYGDLWFYTTMEAVVERL